MATKVLTISLLVCLAIGLSYGDVQSPAEPQPIEVQEAVAPEGPSSDLESSESAWGGYGGRGWGGGYGGYGGGFGYGLGFGYGGGWGGGWGGGYGHRGGWGHGGYGHRGWGHRGWGHRGWY